MDTDLPQSHQAIMAYQPITLQEAVRLLQLVRAMHDEADNSRGVAESDRFMGLLKTAGLPEKGSYSITHLNATNKADFELKFALLVGMLCQADVAGDIAQEEVGDIGLCFIPVCLYTLVSSDNHQVAYPVTLTFDLEPCSL